MYYPDMKKLLTLLAVVLTSFAVYGEVEGLTTLRNTYQDQLNKLADEEMAAVATVQAQYISALAGLEKDFQLKGRLDPLLKAKEERERFSVDRTLEDSAVSKDVPEIAVLQRQYLGGIGNLPLEPAQKRLTLAGFYERSLKNLEAELTKNNDIAGAIEVKKEREGLESREEIVKAREVIERSSKPVTQVPAAVVPAVDVPPVAPVKVAEESKVDKVKIASQVKLRFGKFMDDVADQDWDAALKFVDPEYIKENGEGVSTSVLKMKYSMARHIADNPSSKIRCGDVEVEDSGDRVFLTPEIWANNRSHTLDKMKWVLGEKDGEWYIKLPSGRPDEQRERRMPPPKWRR